MPDNRENLRPANPNQAWGIRRAAHPTAGDKNGLGWDAGVLMTADDREWLRRQAMAATYVLAEVDDAHAQDELLECLGIDPRITASGHLWAAESLAS